MSVSSEVSQLEREHTTIRYIAAGCVLAMAMFCFACVRCNGNSEDGKAQYEAGRVNALEECLRHALPTR